MFAAASCDFTPDTDETDPLPHIFQGREIPKEQLKGMEEPVPDEPLIELLKAEMAAERAAKAKQAKAEQKAPQATATAKPASQQARTEAPKGQERRPEAKANK